jgi:hypothetical protein
MQPVFIEQGSQAPEGRRGRCLANAAVAQDDALPVLVRGRTLPRETAEALSPARAG